MNRFFRRATILGTLWLMAFALSVHGHWQQEPDESAPVAGEEDLFQRDPAELFQPSEPDDMELTEPRARQWVRGRMSSAELLAQLRSLDDSLSREEQIALRQFHRDLPREPVERVEIALHREILIRLAACGDAASLDYLHQLFEALPAQRCNVAEALAKRVGDGGSRRAADWRLLVRALPTLYGDQANEVLAALALYPQRSTRASIQREVVLLGLRLDESGSALACQLLALWTTQPAPTDQSAAEQLAHWQQWVVAQEPHLPPARLPQSTEMSRYTISQLDQFLQSAAGQAGDGLRGLAILERASCLKCHQFGTEGEQLGPNLTHLGSRLTRRQVIESLLFPSQTIADDYVAEAIVMNDGQVHTGVVSLAANNQMVILPANGEKVTIARDQIAEQHPVRTSSMPTGLLNDLSLSEIADLFSLFVPGESFGLFPGQAPSQGMVATVNPLATEAALDVLRQGGNAIDAAIAAALTLGVVDCHNSGIGGGCFLLIRLADGRIIAIDGRETAPAGASQQMYFRDGSPVPTLSRTGPLAVATPGALAAYDLALQEYGNLSLGELLLPAAELAEEGFPLDSLFATRLRATAPAMTAFTGTCDMLLKPDGSPYQVGETLCLPDLATTYRAIAREGTDWFYRGPFAESVGQWMAGHGGLLAASDFAAYQPLMREPIESEYHGHTIVGFPPPSSGGVHVAQILNMIETFHLPSVNETSRADYVHLLAESMKRAFADRAYWLGDSAFADVPLGLLDRDYARRLASQIDQEAATEVLSHGVPPSAEAELFPRHTTHIAAVDGQGNWVALTATINTSFGSKVVVPGTGVLLNNEMDDFSIAPGEPNAFGLIGSHANAIAPGKRPLSSMSPTIVLNTEREPVLTLGAAGGPWIITQVVTTISSVIDLELPLDEALAWKRFHHQWAPDRLFLEEGANAAMIQSLEARGHTVELRDYVGLLQAIARDPATGELHGIADPRTEGWAASTEEVQGELPAQVPGEVPAHEPE